jgi:hypothetical protein
MFRIRHSVKIIGKTDHDMLHTCTVPVANNACYAAVNAPPARLQSRRQDLDQHCFFSVKKFGFSKMFFLYKIRFRIKIKAGSRSGL